LVLHPLQPCPTRSAIGWKGSNTRPAR
jgi:hypothetical protein